MGGETGSPLDPRPPHVGLSPRGRGNRLMSFESRCSFGSIPAWAGKPDSLLIDTIDQGVYPRVGGETCGIRSHRMPS